MHSGHSASPLDTEIRRQSELDRIGDQLRQLAGTSLINTLGNEHDDSPCHGLLDDLGKQVAVETVLAAGQEQSGSEGKKPLVAGDPVSAVGKGPVRQEVDGPRVGGRELEPGANRGGHLIGPLDPGHVCLLDHDLKAREGSLEGPREIVVWGTLGHLAACLGRLAGAGAGELPAHYKH